MAVRLFAAAALIFFIEEVISRKRQIDAQSPLPRNQKFIKMANRGIVDGMAILPSLPQCDRPKLEKFARTVLLNVRSVVAAYYKDKSDLQINANLMVPIGIGSKKKIDFPSLYFADPTRELNTYSCVLVVALWAHDNHCAPHRFSVPVEKGGPRQLFGAPRAYVKNEIQVVGDVQSPRELESIVKGQPPEVEAEIKTYLTSRTSFHSFASFPLVLDGSTVGVLNVQSNRPNIFGDANKLKNEMYVHLEPYCSLLAMALAEANAREFYGTKP